MKQYPSGGIWYPSKLIRLVREDDQVRNHQEIIVEEARFGSEINDSDFTLSSLDLKPGREVVDSRSGKPWEKVWDGKELVNPSGVPTAPANPDRRRWLFWILAVGLALMAIFYFRRVIRQRSSPSNPKHEAVPEKGRRQSMNSNGPGKSSAASQPRIDMRTGVDLFLHRRGELIFGTRLHPLGSPLTCCF